MRAEEIDSIELYYVHNLPESVNVARELQTAEEHIKRILTGSQISVRAIELGFAKIQHLYDAQDSHIEVKDNIDFPADFGFEEIGPTWKAYIASVPGIWLHTLYTKHGDSLFSANYRGYLGAGRRRKVNAGIQESAESRSKDFWAFNNGITILTMSMNQSKEKGKSHTLSGMSIINGAQTTGSIGSVDISRNALAGVRVLCRVIESSDQSTIADIVKFNNTQNAITSWDQYSNDPDQKRIREEFNEFGIKYNIKRGELGADMDLSIDEVMQPLLAFHGRPQDATRGRNQIFDRKQLYQNAFDGKKARHVIFIHTLAKAIDEKRLSLKSKSESGALIQVELDQLALMRNLRFKAFFISLVAATIETAIGKKCDSQTIGFSPSTLHENSVIELTARWSPVVEILLSLVTADETAKDFAAKLSEDGYISGLSRKMNAMLYAMEASKKLQSFADLVTGT